MNKNYTITVELLQKADQEIFEANYLLENLHPSISVPQAETNYYKANLYKIHADSLGYVL